MVEMKEFLSKEQVVDKSVITNKDFKFYIGKENLGMFFWGRGGKQFVQFEKEYIKDLNLKNIINRANCFYHQGNCSFEIMLTAQNFLDCVACLGEIKVKELLKELGGNGEN